MTDIVGVYVDGSGAHAVNCDSDLFQMIAQDKSFKELQAEAKSFGMDAMALAYHTDEQLVWFIGVKRGIIPSAD